MVKEMIRQGDVLFVPTDSYNFKHMERREGHGYREDGIIQEGEATGHHHRLEDPTKADLYRPRWGEPVIVVGHESVRVIHQEHGPVTLEPDTKYEVHIAREFDPVQGSIRQVTD